MSEALIERTVRRFACPYCRRSWSKRWTAACHLLTCRRRPETRSCQTCEHYCPAGDIGLVTYAPEGCAQGLQTVDPTTGRHRINCACWEPRP